MWGRQRTPEDVVCQQSREQHSSNAERAQAQQLHTQDHMPQRSPAAKLAHIITDMVQGTERLGKVGCSLRIVFAQNA